MIEFPAEESKEFMSAFLPSLEAGAQLQHAEREKREREREGESGSRARRGQGEEVNLSTALGFWLSAS